MEGRITAALGVNVSELRQGTGFGVLVKLGQRFNVCVVLPGFDGPVVEERVGEEAGRIGVIDPGDVCLGELLEDGALGERRDIERDVVFSMPVRGSRGDVRAVRVRGARHGREPPIKHEEVLRQGVEDGDMFRRVVIDDLRAAGDVTVDIVRDFLLRHETGHEREFALVVVMVLVDQGLVGMIRAVHLHVTAADAVVWVIGRNVFGLGLRADFDRVIRVSHIGRIAVRVAHHAVQFGVVCETAQEGIEGSVLLDKHHDVLDVGLPACFVVRDCGGSQAESQDGGGEGEDRHCCKSILIPTD